MAMGLLGEMLVERGDISVEQLHTGLAACRHGRWRLGSCLVHYGFIEEKSMLEALADQHGVPFVSESMLLKSLESLDAGVLPRSMLRQLRVIPFRMTKDRIQVAMSNPGDASVIDDIANFTQLHVEPFVASDRTIEMAIDRAQSYAPPEAADEDLLTDIVPDEGATGRWEDLWAPRLDPDLLFRIRSRPKAAGIVLVASYPSLATSDEGCMEAKSSRVGAVSSRGMCTEGAGVTWPPSAAADGRRIRFARRIARRTRAKAYQPQACVSRSWKLTLAGCRNAGIRDKRVTLSAAISGIARRVSPSAQRRDPSSHPQRGSSSG